MLHPVEPLKAVRLAVPSSMSTNERGDFFEGLIGSLLRLQGYTVTQRVQLTGMEIDLLARHADLDQTVYVECKFQRGNVGAPVLHGLLGKCYARQANAGFLFTTSALGRQAKGVVEELKQREGPIVLTVTGPERLYDMVVRLHPGLADLAANPPPHTTCITILVRASLPPCVVFELAPRGTVDELAVAFLGADSPDGQLAQFRTDLAQASLYETLPVSLADGPDSVNEPHEIDPVPTVGHIVTAETLDDYRPCRPEDFVGRSGLQKEISDYLLRVREGVSSTRILAITGPSGMGKSSLVARLAHKYGRKYWRNRLYLHPIDVRSAQSSRFVLHAFQAGIQAAVNAEFAADSHHEVRLGSHDAPCSGESYELVTDFLSRKKRVLVIFFDQFEELFTNDALLPAFKEFRRLALDVSSKQGPIVLGFSWRTGISLSDENPAYHAWQGLRDHRLTKRLGKFSGRESSELITQFERELGTKLTRPLRRRLDEQGQGLPWLLKKLCIHVYRQILDGVNPDELIGRRLNAESLFTEDLEGLGNSELACLRFIAHNSPASATEVFETFGNDALNSLINRRLVIRTGERYTAYWDIFRDYLKDGTVPAIPWTYIPNVPLTMAMRCLVVILKRPGIALDELANSLGYKDRTTLNIVTDLSNCGLTERATKGYVPAEHLRDAGIQNVADFLARQFQEHAFVQRLAASVPAGETFSKESALGLIQEIYADVTVKADTRDKYLDNLIPWLEFCGLIISEGYQFRRPTSRRRQHTDWSDVLKNQRRGRGALFLGATSPSISLSVLKGLVREGRRSRQDLIQSKLRNAVSDLVALDLAEVDGDWVQASGRAMRADLADIAQIFAAEVQESASIRVYAQELARTPGATRQELGHQIGLALGRKWQPASALRYASGLARYFDEYCGEDNSSD